MKGLGWESFDTLDKILDGLHFFNLLSNNLLDNLKYHILCLGLTAETVMCPNELKGDNDVKKTRDFSVGAGMCRLCGTSYEGFENCPVYSERFI